MKRNSLLVFVMVFVLVLITACGVKETEQVSSEEKDDVEVKGKKEKGGEVREKADEAEVEPSPVEYVKLMKLVETAISEQWDLEKLLEYDLGYNMDAPAPLPHNYGYTFRDLTGDGKAEMILGHEFKVEDGDLHKIITEIYTIVDGEPLNVFTSGLRHGADIFSDGTIHEYVTKPGNGKRYYDYYNLKEDGTKDIKDEYFFEGATETYKPSEDSDEILSEAEVEEIRKKYGEPEDLTFTPFLQVEANESLVNNDQAKEIKEQIYGQLSNFLLGNMLDDRFDEYLADGEVEEIWQNGVDSDSDFYKAAYEAYYDEAKHLVTEAGMKAYIEAKIHYKHYGPAPSTFIPNDKSLEIISQDAEQFTLEQTIEIGPQDVDGDSYDIVFHITFAREDHVWKLEAIEEVEYPGKV